MYRNLEAELKRKGLTKGDLAKSLRMNPSTLSFKLNGKSGITLKEAIQIKTIICVSIPLEELFAVTA